MKSITIHNIEDVLYSKILISAKKNRRSLNQEIKDKLFHYFLSDSDEVKDKSFKKYLGIWSEDEFKEFKNNTKDFEIINESEWD